MNFFKKILFKVYTIYYSLKKIDNFLLKSTMNALISLLKNNLNKEELSWVNKIENLRKELKSSSLEFSYRDYGAHSPDSHLTTKEMYEGKIVKKTIGQICNATIPYKSGILLLKIIKNFKPKFCLELGTCLGISSSYLAAALEMNNQGNLITIEGAAPFVALAKETFKKLRLERVICQKGRFQDVLDEVLNEINELDFAFIDGHHDEQATLNYFKQIIPYLSENAMLVFDDIRWSEGMKRAWDTISKDNRIKFSIDLLDMGICIKSNSEHKKQNFNFFLNLSKFYLILKAFKTGNFKKAIIEFISVLDNL